jgi:phosphotransacetylase
MKFIESVFDKLRRHPKRIVFPEGTEPRVLRAAARFVKLKLGAPVVLGARAEIEKVALAEGVSLDHVGVIDPATASDLDIFVQRLEKLKRYRDLGPKAAHEIMAQPNYFAAMMVQYGRRTDW